MYTFDVFDTLITRRTATPKGIFALIQEKLLQDSEYNRLSDYVRRNFYHLRIQAEALARSNFGNMGAEEITLEQIYKALGMTGSLTSEELCMLIELEITSEFENVIGIGENIDKIKSLLNEGEKVVIISDMYLENDTIKAMLVKIDSIFLNINLYVSSQYNKSKWSGNLYKIVKEKENAEYENWIHCGDNPNSDIKSAKMLGIKTEQYIYEPLTEYENEVLQKYENNLFVQLTIGTARNVRLEQRLSGSVAIGCSIGGTILFPYVWWVIQESIKKGINRLYFIARDGFILKKIADIIIKLYKYDIETNYIYGSRRAWRMASFSKNNNDIYKFVGWSYAKKIKDIATLADVLQIPVEALLPFLPREFQNCEHKLTNVSLAALINKLNVDDSFKEYFEKAHTANRKRVADYLKQEINFSDDAFAFVDLAGGGFTQGCLADIISDFYDKQIKNFFFKLDRVNLMDNCIYYNFIPSFLYLSLIIEMVCRAPHGQTVGYMEDKGIIIPEIKEDEGRQLIEHGVNEYIIGIEQFAKNYCSVLEVNSIPADNLELLLQYMEYITKTPDEEILGFLGGMPNSVTGREKEVIEFAPVLSRKAIRSLFLLRTNEQIEEYYKGSSLEYSLLRCSNDDRKKIDFYRKHYNLLLGKLARLPKLISKKKSRFNLASDFPCEFLEERIVLYGSGKLGQDLYKKISNWEKSRVVQWVDKDYKKYQKIGFHISAPEEIGTVEFEQIVIGVLSEDLSVNIRETLMARGIPNEKIIWINLNPRWV